MEDYKQKYEQALENIKKIKVANKSNKELVDFIEYKYPELKESEDERILRRIINIVDEYSAKHQIDNADCIDWLEKQGEQKANKIHPIFRVGDYIRNKKTSDKVLIEQLNVKSKAYCYTSYDGSAEIHSDFPFSKQDEWELIGQQIVEQKSDDSPKWKELTWQDINTLEGIINNVHYEFRNGIGEEGFGKEVLERFREIKGDEYMDTCEQKPTDKVEPKWKKGHDGEFLYENSVVWIHNETKTLATAGLRLDSNTFYIPISELEKLPKEEFEKQGEHKCDCKYVGCHVNDVKRWCHKKQAEILYEKCNIECSEYLKQDEQKPTDYELTPKALFKKGDWVTNGIDFTFQVISIKDNHYLRSDDYFIDIETADKKFRLWTIQDAKDGDVLVVNGEVFIYAHRKQMYSIAVAHCFVDSAGGFYFDGEFGYTEKGNSIHPATKEQRDTLMKAMADAGYTFDFEKKELKKIEQKPAWSEED